MFVLFPIEGESRGGAERGEQGIQSRFCADSREPDMGLELKNHKIMSWAKVRPLTNLATQVPYSKCLKDSIRQDFPYSVFVFTVSDTDLIKELNEISPCIGGPIFSTVLSALHWWSVPWHHCYCMSSQNWAGWNLAGPPWSLIILVMSGLQTHGNPKSSWFHLCHLYFIFKIVV